MNKYGVKSFKLKMENGEYWFYCRGVLSTTATLLSLRDISPDKGITLHASGNVSRIYLMIRFYCDKRNGRLIQHTKNIKIK